MKMKMKSFDYDQIIHYFVELIFLKCLWITSIRC